MPRAIAAEGLVDTGRGALFIAGNNFAFKQNIGLRYAVKNNRFAVVLLSRQGIDALKQLVA